MTPERTNWLLVFMLLCAGLVAAAQFGKLTLTLPSLRAAYPEGGALVPFLISIVGMVGICLGAVAGSIVARAGVTRALTAALIAGGLLSVIEASMPSFVAFAGLRVLEGMSHLAIVVAAPTLLSSIATDDDRPVVMGIWAAFFGISMAGLALGLPGLLALGGLRAVFMAHGLGMLVVAALLYPLLPKSRASKALRVSFLTEHRLIYTNPNLLIAGSGFVCYTSIYIALLAVLPVALELPVWVMTGLPLVSIAGTLSGGLLAKRMPPDRVVMLGFVGTIVLTGMMVVTGSFYPVLFALFLVMGFIPAGAFASIPYFNTDVTDRARATGGLAQLGNVGTTLGTPIFVLAFDQGGLGMVGAIMVGLCMIGLLFTGALRSRIK